MPVVLPVVLLVVDVGNTQTHFGAYDGERLVEHWRFATVRTSTSDELGAALRNLLALRALGFEDIDGSIVSSTVPALRPEWTAMAKQYLGHEMPVVGPGLRTGMPIRIDDPRELGPDRIVNAIAAYDELGGPVIVVDLGTALTFDIVNAEGEYIGDIIAPGVEISLEALSQRAAALPKIDLTPPPSLIAKGTVDAIRAGVIYGYASMVDGIVERLREEMGEEVQAIATGGLAGAIIPYCDTVEATDGLLTLKGLRLVWERNAGS
jgi:type III pantothenate kinase